MLNAARWVAAWLVMAGHVRHIMLADLKDVQSAGLLTKGFYFVTGLGHEAVMVFFVISGLLVGGITLDKWRTGRSNGLADYFIHRWSRVYTVLIPALLVGVLLDGVGLHFFNHSELYTNSAKYHTISLDKNAADQLGIGVLLGNLTMLEEVSVPVLGSNGPLWSLAFEWWYYCLWAACLGLLFCRGAKRWLSGVALALMVVVLPVKILLWSSIWLLGVGAYFYGRSRLPRPPAGVGIALFVTALVISRLSHNVDNVAAQESLAMEYLRDLGLATMFALALVSCFRLKRPLVLETLHERLAGFSYSLYLAHFPLLILVMAWGEQFLGVGYLRQPSAAAYAQFAFVVASLVVYAYVFSLHTERHTASVAALLQRATRRVRVAARVALRTTAPPRP